MKRFACVLSALLVITCGLSAATETLSPPPNIPTRPSYRLHYIRKLIDQQNWKEVVLQFQGSLKNNEISLKEIEKLVSHYRKTKLAPALVAAKKLLELGAGAALDPATAFPIALFAETCLQKQVASGVRYWPESFLGRELQYDSWKKRLFIHLGTKGVPPVGEGRSKVVTRTVLYDQTNPQVMARAVTSRAILREMKMMRLLSGMPGVIQAEGLMVHKDPQKRAKLYTVVTKLYNSGSLQNVFDKKLLSKLSFQNRLTIAHNIMTGIASMHVKNLVHRDLGARNYFVNIIPAKHGRYTVSCVVADMGRTTPTQDFHGGPAQGNGSYMPPEGFFHSKMKGADYCSSDLFAVGTVFWELYFGKKSPWGQECFYRRESKGTKENLKAHLSSLKHAREHELSKLKGNSDKFSTKEKFLSIILQMTDPNPARRGNASELRDRLGLLVSANEKTPKK